MKRISKKPLSKRFSKLTKESRDRRRSSKQEKFTVKNLKLDHRKTSGQKLKTKNNARSKTRKSYRGLLSGLKNPLTGQKLKISQRAKSKKSSRIRDSRRHRSTALSYKSIDRSVCTDRLNQTEKNKKLDFSRLEKQLNSSLAFPQTQAFLVNATNKPATHKREFQSFYGAKNKNHRLFSSIKNEYFKTHESRYSKNLDHSAYKSERRSEKPSRNRDSVTHFLRGNFTRKPGFGAGYHTQAKLSSTEGFRTMPATGGFSLNSDGSSYHENPSLMKAAKIKSYLQIFNNLESSDEASRDRRSKGSRADTLRSGSRGQNASSAYLHKEQVLQSRRTDRVDLMVSEADAQREKGNKDQQNRFRKRGGGRGQAGGAKVRSGGLDSSRFGMLAEESLRDKWKIGGGSRTRNSDKKDGSGGGVKSRYVLRRRGPSARGGSGSLNRGTGDSSSRLGTYDRLRGSSSKKSEGSRTGYSLRNRRLKTNLSGGLEPPASQTQVVKIQELLRDNLITKKKSSNPRSTKINSNNTGNNNYTYRRLSGVKRFSKVSKSRVTPKTSFNLQNPTIFSSNC